jgi:hypothetical protein
VTAIELKVAGVTVSTTGGLLTAPDEAVMLVVPAAAPVANPAELIVAVVVLEEAQLGLVRAAVLPSL